MKYLFCITLILFLAKQQLFVNAFFSPGTSSSNTQQSYSDLYNPFPINTQTNVLKSTLTPLATQKSTLTPLKTQALSKPTSYDDDDLPPPQFSLGLFKSLSTLVKKTQ